MTLGIIPTMSPTNRAIHTGQTLHMHLTAISKVSLEDFSQDVRYSAPNVLILRIIMCRYCGQGDLSRYSNSLRAERSGDRIPVGARFCVPVQTGPGSHTASYRVVTGSSAGVKRPGSGVDLPPLNRVEVKEEYS